MTDQVFTVPTIIPIQIPDVIGDTATYIVAEKARIDAADQQNLSTLTALQTLQAQVQAQIDAANARTVKIAADRASVATLEATQPVTTTPPPDETVPSEAPVETAG